MMLVLSSDPTTFHLCLSVLKVFTNYTTPYGSEVVPADIYAIYYFQQRFHCH
jgi:hypothetical protein